jgi:nucleotide-binding universal stress UspA family protein
VPADSGLEPEYVVRIDFLPEALLESVERYDVDLIVMGANRAAMPRAMAHIPWAALHEVVSHAPCPVLTVAG